MSEQVKSDAHGCATCHGTHKVHCGSCKGTGKKACKTCKGSGKKKCSYCDGGYNECEECGGTGKDPCPVCHRGYVRRVVGMRPCTWCDGNGGSKDEYGRWEDCIHCSGSGQEEHVVSEVCPNCHGDYIGKGHGDHCKECGGTGKIKCSTCKGSGHVKCKDCGGLGHHKCKECGGVGDVECPDCKARRLAKEKAQREARIAEEYRRSLYSDKKRWLFVLIGMVFGWSGLHFIYIKQWAIWFWGLFPLIMIHAGATIKTSWTEIDPVSKEILLRLINNPLAIEYNSIGLKQWIGISGIALFLFWWIGSLFLCKTDGKGKRLS